MGQIAARHIKQGMMIRGMMGNQFVHITAVNRTALGYTFSYAGETSDEYLPDHLFYQGDPERDEPFEDVGYRG